jgi:RNA polymerase sigma factor (sigma-70 family)
MKTYNKELYNNDVEFLTLREYEAIAKKTIKKFCKHSFVRLLKNPEFVGNVTHDIMMGDWRYKEQDGVGKTRYSYRNQCAVWSIKKSFDKNKHTKKDIVSLTDFPVYDAIPENHDMVDTLLNSLPEKDRTILHMHFILGMSKREIARQYKVSGEAIRQKINKAIEQVKGRFPAWVS